MDDQLFFTERKPIRKIALLSTIPCSVGVMMFAVSLILNNKFTPVFFEGDTILALPFYGLYLYGLWLSYRQHRHIWPVLLFFIHIVSLFLYYLNSHNDWIVYSVILTILFTSVLNQYLRTGSPSCSQDVCIK